MVVGRVGKGVVILKNIKVALISGISGQDGSYLADYLLAGGYEVIGLTRGHDGLFSERINHLRDRINY